MQTDVEAELRAAVTEGLVSEQEMDTLREEARRLGRGPLVLLRERGRLSEDTLISMIAQVRGATPPAADLARDTPSSGVPEFPVTGWERYQCVRFLGEGGMGRVFLARDPRLHRDVALKFIRGDEPGLTQRFLHEAQAQARVNHERVCKVYEVGEVQGRVYIAMQFIAGRTLGALAGELSLEQKVLVLRAAAEGIHEAHRVGLVHRDLKPSNIMVERAEDGSLRPYVMDFGLARDWNDGSTVTGAVMGTPHYMSPEQARGEVSTLDRRADVYSLGATLYSVLTGRPPVEGANALEVLQNLLHREPPPPRSLHRDIPADLEAIALKCLEKERSARYDSARALAEELERFLAGEPVQARSTGLGYRLRKTLRKHRLLASVIAGAAVLVLLALGSAWFTRREAAVRERLSRRFTESVERIEALARYSDLARLHDTRADRNVIRARMTALEAEIRDAGEQAVGPGHYALGRGYLALGDEARARESLEAAWRHGSHEPRVAYALAVVLGHQYQAQLLEAERLREPARREARQREVERNYREPALAYLRQSEGAEVPSTAYGAALLAFYENRWDEALARLDTVGTERSWFHEAPKLRGDILLARAMRHWNQGRHEPARADFEAGRVAYAEAAGIGESVAAIYTAQASLEYGALVLELYGPGEVTPRYTRALEALGRARTALPEEPEALLLEARLHRRLAEHQRNLGDYSEALPEKAVGAASRALELAPASVEARRELGRAYWIWGDIRQSHSLDPREQLRRAIESFEHVAPEARDLDFLLDLGTVSKSQGDYQEQVGADPLPAYGKAIAAYRAAVQLDPQVPEGWINLGLASYARATHPGELTGEGDLTQALEALDKARSLNPGHVVPYFYAGLAHALVAQRMREEGGESGDALERSERMFREGIALAPGIPQLHNGLCLTLVQQAQAQWDHGGDPFPALERAQSTCEQSIRLAPKGGYGHINLSEVLAHRALYQRERGEDPTPSVRAADAALGEALGWLPENAGALANRGLVHAILATFERDHGRDPRLSSERAEVALRQALALNPAHAEAWFSLGEALGARALAPGGRRQDLEDARRAFGKALYLNAKRPEFCLGFGHFLRRGSSAHPTPEGWNADASIAQGKSLASRIQEAHPDWPAPRLLSASLTVLQADLPSTPPLQAREWRKQAREDLAQALSANRAFQREWAGVLQRLEADEAR